MPRIPKLHFHWHRFSERAGSGHSVESLFRSQRRPLDPESSIAADESIRTREQAIWYAGAVFYMVCGLVPFIALWAPSFPGFEVPAEITGTWQLGVGVVALLVGPLFIYFGLRNIPTLPWLPFAIGFAIVLLAVALLATPEYGPEIMGLLVLPTIAAAFYLPARAAIPMYITVAGVLAYIGYYNRDEPYGVLEASMMLMFLIGASTVMAFARDRIQQGIELNIEIAGRDPLTGAANLRRLRERLENEIRRAKRRDLPVTLVMLDLDDFGEVNRHFSHTLGDAILVACTRAMQKVIRKDELLARRGDDEFAVVAVGESGDDLLTLIDRLKTAVMIERQRLCPDVNPGVSVGFATWRAGESPAALMRRADSALHVGRMFGPEDV